MSGKGDARDKMASSTQNQQDSESKCELKHKDKKRYGKECDAAKLRKLLGYCPQKIPGQKPADVSIRENKVQAKVSQVAQASRDFSATKIGKRPAQEGSVSYNQLVEDFALKTENCQLQQETDSSSEKNKSDENANSLICGTNSKLELPNDDTTDFIEIKDASLSSNKCQEDLSSNHENIRNRKGKIISSRYMQTAKKMKNKPTSQTIRSVPNNGNAKKMTVSDKKKVERINLNSTPAILTDEGLQNNNKNIQITSTPAIHALPFSQDVSSIMADVSTAQFVPRVEESKVTSCMQAPTTHKNVLPTNSSSSKAHFTNPIEIMYCRYLQAVFLEAKSAETLKKKSQNVKEQLFHLWKKNQDLLETEASLDLEISACENLQHMNYHLDSQENYMEPVNEVIEKLDCEYKEIANALDTTRHQLPTSGIILCNMNDLSDTLKETEKLSELLTATLKPYQEPLTDLASTLSKIEETVQIETKELHRCLKLTKHAESLTAQESSLLIQSIQKNIELKS